MSTRPIPGPYPAIAWFEETLSAATVLDTHERRRLALAIRAVSRIVCSVWLTDVAGLDRANAVALQRWSARALLGAAMGDPPPVPGRASRGRSRRR
jgi:hypothetical protein